MMFRSLGRTTWLVVGATLLAALPACAQAKDDPIFVGEVAGQPSIDMSGMACAAADSTGTRQCLAIDDQGMVAQWASVKGGKVVPGTTVDLKDANTVGAPVTGTCEDGPSKDAKADVDGEAVAYAAPYFYVIGSHGCGRNSDKFSHRAFKIYRIPTIPGEPVLASTRAYTALEMSKLNPYLQLSLNAAQGANVEGLTIVGDRLLIGMRGPVVKGSAFILSVRIDDVFAAGPDRKLANALVTYAVPLGKNVGIRDLATLPDGRVLVLTGPTQEQDIAYTIVLFDPASQKASGALWTAAPWTDPKTKKKAEALALLGVANGVASMVVLYDGQPNGAPEMVSVRLP